jgi:hypothetical protein
VDPAELQPHELMQIVTEFFEAHGVPYLVAGSMASMAYGEPRFTNDIDIVADVTWKTIPALGAAFAAPEYYFSEQAAREAVTRRFQFNIIHPASGLKVDVILPRGTEFARIEMNRGRRITSDGEYSAWFASPEDVILNKLLYFQMGGSEKHLRDIAGMMKLLRDKLDRSYLDEWVAKLGVAAEWRLVADRLQESPG